MSEAFHRNSCSGQVLQRYLAFLIVLFLTWPFGVAAQAPDVGPSGCVANCGGGPSGGYSGGGGYGGPDYTGVAIGAFGAFMNGFLGAIQSANDPRTRSTNLNNQGVAAYNRGDYLAAIRLYEAALKLNPRNNTAKQNLFLALREQGDVYREKQKYIEAEGYFERAHAINPNNEFVRAVLEEMRRLASKRRAINKGTKEALTNFSRLEKSLEAQDSSGGGLGLMENEEPDLPTDPGIGESEKKVATRLGEVEEKVLKAPPGTSAWDGGYGGTLDSPQAAGVPSTIPVSQRPPQTGAPRYEAAANPGIHSASQLARKGDFNQALEELQAVRKTEPDTPGLGETIAYVKGLKAGNSPTNAARLSKLPSAKAEIILDALSAGDGSWQASIRYLEGMRQTDTGNPKIQDALVYLLEMQAHQKSIGSKDPPSQDATQNWEKVLRFPPVPSPQGYKSGDERRAMAKALSDKALSEAIVRTDKALKRMEKDFEGAKASLREHAEEAKKAEEDALISALDLLTSGGLGLFPKNSPNARTLHFILDRGKTTASQLAALNKPPLEKVRSVMLDAIELFGNLPPEAIQRITGSAALASFVADYGVSAARWGVAWSQTQAIVDNLDAPNGMLDAQKALSRLQEDLIRERKRRQGLL